MKTKLTIEEARKLKSYQRYRLRKAGVDVPFIPRKRGYKQTPEHIEKRVRSGKKHHAWKGDEITQRSGRSRAYRLYPEIGPCVLCGNPKSERHHIDGNTCNNNADNILIVCRRCHMEHDGRLEQFREMAIKNQPRLQEKRWPKK